MELVDLENTLSKFIKEVWNSGDFTNLSEYVSPEYQVIDDPGDRWDGKTLSHKELTTRVMYSRNAFPDLKFDIQEMVPGHNKVVIRWRLSGTHEGDLHLLPATNKQFSISGMTFYYFSNGKICGHRQLLDRLGFIEQIKVFEVLANV